VDAGVAADAGVLTVDLVVLEVALALVLWATAALVAGEGVNVVSADVWTAAVEGVGVVVSAAVVGPATAV
jgi:hypothetical protein